MYGLFRRSSSVPTAPVGPTSLKHPGLALLLRDIAMTTSTQRPKVGHVIEIIALAICIARQRPDVVELGVE